MNWYKKSQEDFKIPKISYQGTCYHGSTYRPETDIFDNLSSDYSDWETIWVCPEEYIAEEFASDWQNDDGIPVVFRINVNLNNAANIRPYDQELWDELMETMGFSDIREIIPYLKQNGCDGWITTGSIGQDAYFDIAVFSNNLAIQDAKIKINNQWTPYMDLNSCLKS